MAEQKGMQAIVADLSAKAADKALQDKNDAIIRFYAQLFDKAAAYMNIIVGLGYGGFFATWSATKAYLTRKELLTSGLLVLFSLFVFVCWQVFFMVFNARNVVRLDVLVKASVAEFPKVRANEELREAKMRYRLRYAWIVALVLTALPAFGGALVLMYAFVCRLLPCHS